MNRSKKTILTLLVLILLTAAAAVLCIGMRVAPAVNHALRISELLQPVLDAKNQTTHIAVSTGISGDTLELESDLFLVSEDNIPYLAIEQKGTVLYVSGNVLFLENGKAFRIGETLQLPVLSYTDLLAQIETLFTVLEITAEESENQVCYTITVTGEQIRTLLAAASLGEALPAEGIEVLSLQLTEKNEKLDQIIFSGSGSLNGTPIQLHTVLSGFRILAEGDYPIPEAVKKSAATVNPDELFSLTEDLYRLVLALTPFADMDSISGTLKLNVDCGLLQLDTQMELSDLKPASGGQIDPETLRSLPEMLGWLCMEGEITCTARDNAYVYKLALDQAAMQELSRMILPELARYGSDLTEGSVSILLADKAITSMKVSIQGNIRVLIAQIPITVGAEFIFD